MTNCKHYALNNTSKNTMENTLNTDCLQLRPMTSDDAQAVFDYRSDTKTNQYQSFIPQQIDDVYTFIGECAAEMNETGTWYQLVIIHKQSQQIIGDIGLQFIDEHQVEIGITIAQEFQMKGYATEALTPILDLLFNHLKKHRIIASIDPRNTASERLLKRLGFRKEAHFFESYYSEGEWLDDVQYGLLSKEWS